MTEPVGGPLAGVTVIDFGQIFQGSYASVLMAKAGATVIKIEPPHGEPLRQRAPPGRKTTLPFAMLNANKRGVTLNLKSARGRELLFEMVRRGDVVLENFGPGAMDTLGVGWSVLREVNPRLIYATGTGYGISGPDMGNLAMDLTVQAASGIMSVTGFPDRPPVRAGVTVADFMGGIHLYAGVVTALYERDRSGVGRLVETAMQETVYYTLASSLETFSRTGKVPPRAGNAAGGTASPYGLYPLKEGYLAIHPGTEQHWRNILRAGGSAGRSPVPDHARPVSAHGGGRCHRQRVDQRADQGGSGRPGEAVPHSMLAGAGCFGSDARSAYARARDAGMGGSSGSWARGVADEPAAAARDRGDADDAQPEHRPAQRGSVWRVAGAGCGGDRGAAGRRGDLERCRYGGRTSGSCFCSGSEASRADGSASSAPWPQG
jgi:crotonobetainyl-CoA:carnitine CoA-transferase CaiB-like acyl-CoA transferase